MSSDIAAFVAARLDESYQIADAIRNSWITAIDGATAVFSHHYDAARMLRRVAADRLILARYEDCLARMEDDDYPAGVARDQAREYEDFVLPAIAQEWNDHPDYRPEWKP